MPTQLLREIFGLTSNLPAVLEELETGLFVKGFVSVESVDSEADLAPPENFRVEPFLSAPTVLVDHNYVVDTYGNMVSAGKALELYAAQLVTHEDENIWGVKSLETGQIANTLLKSQVPHLSEGTKGLFSVIEVTHSETAARVKSGELDSFSWKGTATAELKKSTSGQTITVLHDIDLFEVTLTGRPINKDTALVIGKSEAFGGSKYFVYAVELSKSNFKTAQEAQGYLDLHQMKGVLTEDDNTFCSLQGCGIDLTQLVRVKMVPGVEIIAGPAAKKVVEVERVPADFMSGFKQVLSRDSNMSRVTIEAADIVVSSKSVVEQAPAKEAPVQEVETVVKSEAPTFDVEAIVKQVTEAVVGQFTPVLQELSKSVQILQKSAEAPVVEEAKATEAVEAQETEATVVENVVEEEVVQETSSDESILNSLIESIKILADEVDGLKKSSSAAQINSLVSDLRKAIPPQSAREETFEKSRKQVDKNSVFDSHPVLGGFFLNR